MKRSFIDLLRQPDSVLFQYDDSPFRFEEPYTKTEQTEKIDYIVEGNACKIVIHPSGRGIKRVKLRWRGDMSDVILTLGDEYERIERFNCHWGGLEPRKNMPWYFHAYDGEKLNCFGVKTGPNAFCTFNCDAFGITLWLDVRSGGAGVQLKEDLTAAYVVCREGKIGETPYDSAVQFCKMMCEKPVLPKEPVFGVNNWYWAYGNITHDSVMEETKYLKSMCRDTVCDPYMIIDDGWQRIRFFGNGNNFNGGPWDIFSPGFPSMEDTAHKIKEMGAKPGIWFRPLKTSLQVPEEAISKTVYKDTGLSLDPTHPFVKELVATDVKRIRSWGFELIKHDFSTMDILTDRMPQPDGDRRLYDSSMTNCEAIRRLYMLIQESADGAEIIGCNTVNHLVAGIHSVQRAGNDTSGVNFELTRADGVHSLLRMPQNGTFFAHDPDCAAFTDMVPADVNLDFLELAAVSGAVTLASVTPNILKDNEMAIIREIYKIASQGGWGAVPTDWLGNDEPSHFATPDGKEFIFDWYRVYDGVRHIHGWSE